MYDRILLRYGELSLKKDNRNKFVKLVNEHIQENLKDFKNLTFEKEYMRFFIVLNGEDPEKIIPLLKIIPGIHSFSLVKKCDVAIDAIKELALSFKDELINKTIKVETNRANKLFPMKSLEISQEVARTLFRNISGLKADVHNPEVVMSIDVRDNGAYIYTNSIEGFGGLPSKSLGKGLLLISGGIDSVVAGIESIRRGVDVEAIHFASPPYTSMQSLQKVVDLLTKAAIYPKDHTINLYVVPFTNIQDAIYNHIRNDYCITIMRRIMYKISVEWAKHLGAKVLINGENLGQVASQTIESMAVINEVTNMPIIRPLVTLDKQDIIDKAIKYDTYDISILPYEDCCTIFVPKHPQIKPRMKEVEIQEAKFDFTDLINQAISNIQTIKLTKDSDFNVFSLDEDLFD